MENRKENHRTDLIKYLYNRFHFQYIWGDKYKHTILWCLYT